jgi:hypothetical protein
MASNPITDMHRPGMGFRDMCTCGDEHCSVREDDATARGAEHSEEVDAGRPPQRSAPGFDGRS